MEKPTMAGSEDSAAAASETPEKTSVFIPKDAVGGGSYKAGDRITLTVKDVDPDTGEIEAEVGDSMPAHRGRMMDEAIDNMEE